MTINEYQKKCVSKLPRYLYRGDEALMALLALNGTTGDCVKLYKKTLYEGAELPKEALLDNLSEIIFCTAIFAHSMDVNLDAVFKRSVERINKTTESYAGDDDE